MIELLLNTIYAVGTGSWDLLLECAREMIPYCSAYNNVNYARYLTNFLGDMQALQNDFPKVHQRFSDGDFAAQLTNTNRFSRSETDKVIEMTINKGTKTPGGATRFSTKISGIKRWEITPSYTANIPKCLHQHLCYNKQKCSDLNPSSIRRDENNVQAVVDVLTNVSIHPFSEKPFASISTGITVNENDAASILEAKINGMNEMGKFISDRLQPGKTVSFFDPIKRSNTMTFDTIKKKRTCKIKNKVMSIESSTDLFLKISLITQSRNIKIRDLFLFPLGALPLVFAD